ncbi:AIPR family protein [Chryseobacterium salviniae]|uniref:AIPR family protein n=1 Tax=Chryseobacterium salviniae TaxID=3101750 RepID=A0ABU6HXF6_9FLAO|nr:AIPR family protein [Chryseobacterium sp. T9W2-O]MEC3877695.1 AIPR family protein [Chryseobacterium sp. T9W2-O]
MEKALKNYIEELKSDVASLVYSDGEGASFEDKFTEYCIEVFESIGKSEGARVLSYIHPNNQGGIDWKINGYCLKDQFRDENNKTYFETLDLFITSFRNDSFEYNIPKDEYTKSLNQIKRFINSSLKRHIDYIDHSHTELNELIKIIGKQGKDFDRINVYFLINGFSNHEKEKLEINDVDVSVHTWDVTRLFKINETNSVHEPIEIEFEKFTQEGKGLQCLQVPSIDEMYDCYLAIVPGEVLANLYKEFSNELLESNVRAFLGQAGKFNKGIRDTIRTKPQMFLPYNNGITATAESVETKSVDGQMVITRLNDFQIVNGGQTTASLYHTQKKFKDADLSKIFVQMKLTVIKDKEQKNSEVPNISRFANSQNKVSELDLSSNNPYFVQIENLSRKKYVVNSENKNQSLLWFFERANGQYRETLNKQTPSQQKKFKEQNPSHLKFVKSDVAKFINLWELEPHFVSQGSQKNFIHFTKKINILVSKNKLPGENFYKKMVANAIIFKSTDKLFGRKGVDAIGDTNLKSFTVAYTVSYFHYLTDNRLDLWKIYEDQKIDDFLMLELRKLLVFVYDHLVKEAHNSLISEYAKRESSWNRLKETHYVEDLQVILRDYLISTKEKEDRESEKDIDTNDEEDRLFIISEIHKFGLKFWDGFVRFLENNSLEGFNKNSVEEVLKAIQKNKNFLPRDITIGRKMIKYLTEDPSFLLDMKVQSKLEDKESVEIKYMFDRLKLLAKDDWKKIIDLANHTNIFTIPELGNVKSIQLSLSKNERIKEQSLMKAYESIKKLKRFGINV